MRKNYTEPVTGPNQHRIDRSDENERMIETQLIRRGITNRATIDCFRAVQRHWFVPDKYQTEAYGDFPLSIGAGQTISQPFVIALMLQHLCVAPNHDVLEVGAGSGYSTALLSCLARRIDSLEYYSELLDRARERLAGLGCKNVTLFHHSGWDQVPLPRQYDRIVVWASPNQIPDALLNALKASGKMVIPVGKFDQQLLVVSWKSSQVNKEFVDWVRFVPLINGDPL